MEYYATANAIKILNDSKIKQIDIERDIKSSIEKGFSFDNLLKLNVRIDEDNNRYIFDKVNDYGKKERLKEQPIYRIKYVNNKWKCISNKTN